MLRLNLGTNNSITVHPQDVNRAVWCYVYAKSTLCVSSRVQAGLRKQVVNQTGCIFRLACLLQQVISNRKHLIAISNSKNRRTFAGKQIHRTNVVDGIGSDIDSKSTSKFG